jgi:hypothetical protein
MEQLMSHINIKPENEIKEETIELHVKEKKPSKRKNVNHHNLEIKRPKPFSRFI